MANVVPRKIMTQLWFPEKALEAVTFYVTLCPGSRVDQVTPVPVDTPTGPAGSVRVIEFTLAGQRFIALEAGPLDPFNHAISLYVSCADQAEVDRLWEALDEMMRDPDQPRAKRAMEAMLKMQEIDPAALERAFRG